MGSLPTPLIDALRRELNLTHAIETGTYKGGTATILANRFPSATSIELSRELHQAAAKALVGIQNLTLLHGSSPEVLRSLERVPGGALFWLDAHWSGLDTAGHDNPCPVLEEIRAIGPGHPSDCLLIDDARLFNHPEWPSLLEVMTTINDLRPAHHVTVIHDLIVAVPLRVRAVVDAFARYGDEAVVRAAEDARLGRRTALVNRVVVHPVYLSVLRTLVWLKHRLIGEHSRFGR